MAARPHKRSHARSAAHQRKLRYLIGPAREIKPGESRKFMLPIEGADEECFVINCRGDFHAYVNRCRHIPIPMDWVDNSFFAEGGRYLMCQTHGALYEPATGECLAGPTGACGKFLFRVPIEVERGLLYARPPEEAIEAGI